MGERCRLRWSAALLAAMLLVAAGAREAAASPLSLFRGEDIAQRHCPDDTVVWLDLKKRRYYLKGQRLYGQGRTAVFACRNEAEQNRYRRSLLGRR
jgi:hypothetical protein